MASSSSGCAAGASAGRNDLPAELASLPRYENVDEALAESRPDAVSINTYPDTHEEFCLKAFDAGCHVFVEKPLATTVDGAQAVVDKARETGKKLVVGYILRVHPAWQEFIQRARTLGKPLVMRMNLNQQSRGPAWNWHRNLMDSLTPIVDCGVHYVDVMCQMTGAKPVPRAWHRRPSSPTRPSGRTTATSMSSSDDGSVGWYEAGWGPMMSEVAFFVKDVVGPKGCVSIVMPQEGQDHAASDDIDSHTKTNALLCHSSEIDEAQQFRARGRVDRHGRRAEPSGAVRPGAGVPAQGDPRGPRPFRAHGERGQQPAHRYRRRREHQAA